MTDYTLITNWYNGYIPTFKNLLDFSIRSNILTKGIISTPILQDSKAQTAYMVNGKCVLPALFFEKKFYIDYLEIDEKDAILAAISVINGSQIHEALHHLILGAKADYRSVLETCLIRLVLPQEQKHYTKIFKDCFNIVEDVYSNYYCLVNHPNLNLFLDLLIKTIFNPKIFYKCYDNFYTNDRKINDFLSCLVSIQNDENLIDNQFAIDYSQHIDLLLSARNIDLTLEQRFELASKLYDLIKSEFEDENKIDEFDVAYEEVIIDHSIEVNELSQFIQRNREILDEIEKRFYEIISDDNFTEIKVELVDVATKRIKNQNKLDFDNNFNGFSSYIQNARALKPMPVEPKYVGQVVLPNRLFMAKIDGKIFSKRDTQVIDRNFPEIILLGDGSGSMSGSGLLPLVASATKSIFRDLKDNNIWCSVYFHSTDYKGCVVYAIASNNMPLMKKNQFETTHDFESRFDAIMQISIAQNADGYALEFVANRFSKRLGKKIVVVLSDGQPSYHGYGGNSAENHIKNICKNLRNSNISVVSLSLTREVMSNNNRIYGEKNNIEAYGSKLQTNLKQLISQIVI